jgi:hypothetical protein
MASTESWLKQETQTNTHQTENQNKNIKKLTFRMPFSGSEAMSGMLEPAIR